MSYMDNHFGPYPLREGSAGPTVHPNIPLMLASIVPGLGHMLNGDILDGIQWMIAVLAGYACLIVPGVLLHIYCFYAASKLRSSSASAMTHWNSVSVTQAALLNFFVPGLGHMVSGYMSSGLLWMLFVCLGYVCFIIPGIVLHILCVVSIARKTAG